MGAMVSITPSIFDLLNTLSTVSTNKSFISGNKVFFDIHVFILEVVVKHSFLEMLYFSLSYFTQIFFVFHLT